jgi:hypothetical protein
MYSTLTRGTDFYITKLTMAMEHQDAIDTICELIYELEEDKYFSEYYSEELEECDFYNEQQMNEIPYKQLKEVTKDFSNSHYMMMRAVIESINKFKEDFEKQVRAKEAYKKVYKKQSDKIKQLKEEQYDNMERLAEEEYMYLVGFKEFDDLIKAEQENKELKEENKKLKELKEENKKQNDKIKELKKELLIASFNGYKAGCNYNQSVEDEIDFLNDSGQSQELIKEVFDESYQGGLNLVYNIETKDYSGEDDEDESEEEEDEEKREVIIGIECRKCKQVPYPLGHREIWCLYIYTDCCFCGEKKSLDYKWGKDEE